VITSTDNPRVKEVLRLRRSSRRRRSGLFVAEGRREVERALAAGLAVRDLYVAPELIDDWPRDRRGGADGDAVTLDLSVTEVTPRVLAHMSYRAEPEGVLAVVEAPQRAIPDEATLLLVAVGIEKPGNLGAMARTADAAGADALLLGDAESDPWNPNAIRASTGVVFTLPIVDITPAELAAMPLRKVAAILGAPTSYDDVDLADPIAILIGAEDTGLPGPWREIADVEVEIPMRGATADSLNASAAAAVLLFEAVRQRR
jgi:TrmH family RNA methyltransferase